VSSAGGSGANVNVNVKETGGMGEGLPWLAIRGWRPKRLIARLAALEEEDCSPSGADRAPKPGAFKAVPLGAFALGLLTSLLLGGAATALLAIARPTADADQAVAATGKHKAQPQLPARLDLEVVRGEQPTSFPLNVSGLERVGNARVVLRNLPEALWFSRGERRDEHTWDLAGADLDDLAVTLRPGTPHAFMVDIEVIDANAAPLAQTLAAVRLIDPPAEASHAPASPLPSQALAAPPEGGVLKLAKADMAARNRQANPAVPPPVVREARARAGLPAPDQSQEGEASRRSARPLAEEPARRLAPAVWPPPPRPAGMSALGAVSREPAAEGRWLWWRLPAVAGQPLSNGEGARR
jgi:hypothetical protein